MTCAVVGANPVPCAALRLRIGIYTGDVILSAKRTSNAWRDFFALRDEAAVPTDFLNDRPLNEPLWDEAAATHFASIAASLHEAGTPIGSMDAMIAGHAMATGAVLVTNNARHFSRVTHLTVANWSQEH